MIVQHHNPEAEKEVLGAMLFNANALAKALDALKPEDFYEDVHRQIFRAMAELSATSTVVDLITLTHALRKTNTLQDIGGAFYLSQIACSVVTGTNVEHHARLVEEAASRRAMTKIAQSLEDMAESDQYTPVDALVKTERRVSDLLGRATRKNYRHLKDLVTDAYGALEERSKQGGVITGVTSGLSDLDALTLGWEKGDLIIVAGRPSMGKTALSLNFARSAALQHIPVGLFSLEMSGAGLTLRLFSLEAKIDLKWLRSGNLTNDQWAEVAKASDRLMELPILLDDSPQLSISELRVKARRMKQEEGIGLIIVDYLQLMRAPGEDGRQQEVAAISRALKAVGRELELPVIALSQLSREVEKRATRKPQLSDLRESGSIEQEADIVVFPYRPAYYDHDSLEPSSLIVAKHRNGPTGEISVFFEPETGRFCDLKRREAR